MLLFVNGSSLLRRPRLLARWSRLLALGVASLGALLPSRAAFAQESADSGWFDAPPEPEAAAPVPQPYYDAARSDAQPAPAPAPQTDVPDNDPSALTTFRPALDPYGSWVDDSKYGTVWVPNSAVVGADFAPYVSRGRWALTAENDWIWQSDYPFGWAVFHYGRWVWIAGQGWSWVPGRTYANAWVVWRTPTAGYAYVGWAPMPPTWGWRYGYSYSLWYSPPLPYVFCPSAYVFDRHVHHHIVRDRHLVGTIASSTRVYPTPYRAPAQPTLRGSGPERSPRLGPSVAPRGPAMSAARVPPSAVPSLRTAPPAAAQRLSPARTAPFQRDQFRAPPNSRARVDARQVVPRDTVRRTLPSQSQTWSSFPRSSAADRMRSEPRAVSPERIRVTPSSRDFSPAPSRSFAPPMRSFSPAPSRSFAPSPSFSPSPARSFGPSSFPRSHGGGFRRR
jgi:hypothetical protein